MNHPKISSQWVQFGVSESQSSWLDYVLNMDTAYQLALDIDDFTEACIEILRKRSSKSADLFEDDFVFFSALNRTIEVSKGFEDAVKSQNFSVMPVLLRVQINTLATLEFIESHERKSEIIRAFNQGTEFRKMKAPGGKGCLSEKILIENAVQRYPWIQTVYSKTSSWVHLSPTSTYSPLELSPDGLVSFRVPRIPDAKYQPAVDELCACMKACLVGIQDHIRVWALSTTHQKDAE